MDKVFLLPRPNWVYHRLKLRLRPLKPAELDDVREVMEEYGLELTRVPQIPAVIGRSRSLIVDTLYGKKVFKRYKESMSVPAIVHEHSILTYLAQVNFPAPRLFTTLTGETLVRRGEAVYALFDFIEGGRQYHNYVLLPAQARRFAALAGSTLAALHNQLGDFAPAGQHSDGFKSLAEDRWRDLEWYMDKLAHCTAETPCLSIPGGDAGETITILVERADWIQDTLYKLDHALKVAAPPRLIIHGDYGPYNLLVEPDESVVVLDFELARLDWRITDLAKAIPNFSYNRRLGFSFRNMESFLGAYRAHSAIGDEELQLVPTVWQFLSTRRVVVCWDNYCNTQVGHWLTRVREHLRWIDWIADNRDRQLVSLASSQGCV